jgi:hypothetical protein
MSGDIVRLLSELGVEFGGSGEADAMKAVERLLEKATGAPLTVKTARDTFTKMLARAREGDMQLFGRKTEDMAVMVSLQDLAALVRASRKALAFGSALDEVGFVPMG